MEQSEVSLLRQCIRCWDGKSAADITEVYQAYCTAETFVDVLIELLSEVELQSGVSWLLKHHCEQLLKKNELFTGKTAVAISETFAALSKGGWQARLHILQTLPYLDFSYCDKRVIDVFLRSGLTDSNTFVRAWSYNGFYLLARSFPEYRQEAEQFFSMALRDEPASVKARVRQLVKQGF